MRRGIVYQSGSGKTQGDVEISPIVDELKKIAKKFKFFAGVLMILGLVGLGFIYAPLAKEEVRYQVKALSTRNLNMIPTPAPLMPEWQVPDEFFSVYIPKIDAISRVVENVDSASKVAYQNALKMGVAQAAGLAAPGTRGTTYLFSHSVSNPINFARYNAVFYLLDRLAIGDGVEIVYKGKYLKYEVTDMVKLPASDTRYLQPQDAEEKLVLQTCWPPGTTLQRLYVVAKRVY